MANLEEIVPTVLLSYLVGAIPFGYLVARGRGVDIFKHGSGNIGATNVGRVLGRRFGIMVFLLDFAKGAVPVLVAQRFAVSRAHGGWDPGELGVAAGLSAFLGHLFPVYLRFRGGKGVATGAGVVAVLLPLPALGALATWLAVVAATRYVSVASVSAAAALCVVRLAVTPDAWLPPARVPTVFCFVALALILLRHRSNLARLVQGRENRLPENARMLLLTRTLHVLAAGVWLGAIVFFILATGIIFQTFQRLAASDTRPPWLPLPSGLDREQANRIAGVAVGPLFDWYFALQAICGLVALGTALGWPRNPGERWVPSARIVLLVLALLTVLAGWPLARYVGRLRVDRYAADPAVADAARAAFASWHLVSLLLNFVTLLLVLGVTALAAQLPAVAPPDRS